MVRGDALKLLDGAARAELENRAGSERPLQVGPEDWCAVRDGHFFEQDAAATTVTDDSVSVGCADVADPLRVITEHRYQVTGVFVVSR